MKIITTANKGCGQLSSNETFFADIWFSGVKTEDKAMAEGVDYCGTVKASHKEFYLDMLEKLMKKWRKGSNLVIKGTPRVPGDIPLMAIKYKYKSHKVLGFIDMEGTRSTVPGVPYLSRYPDNYSNVYIFPVLCPNFLGRYFSACNVIKNQKQDEAV